MVLTVISGACSLFGDLVASLIKRYFGVKDFGNLLPGHGGIMDRFDSVIFVSPFMYITMTMFPIFIENI